MAKFIIDGSPINKLSGTVALSGNKNSILPCIAACLLTKEKVTLHNVPKIADVYVFIDILKSMGVTANFEDHSLVIQAENINSEILPSDLTKKLRASVLLSGPLLARLGKVEFAHPGGDIIGKRSIEPHLEGFKILGYEVEQTDRHYKAWKGQESLENVIFLPEASVTATENLLLAASLHHQSMTFKNCAREPHIVDLCNLLQQMGVKIDGIGESTLTIHPAESLGGADFTIDSDAIEFGTYAIVAAITKGEVTITNCPKHELEPIINPLKIMGINFQINQDGSITCTSETIKPIAKLHTNIWPGFPTDMMSVVIVLATQANGVSLLHDWMYESRMFFVDKLISMGANIFIADPHRVIVSGPSKLMARDLETPDIRAGMAILLAALIAQGKSTINKAELIERGYEDVVNKLKSLGANIERVD